MLSTSEIHALLKAGEGPTVEFKVNTPYTDNLARLVSAFANATGGTLIVGIKEPNTIIGTNPQRFLTIIERTKEKLQGEVQLSHYTTEVEGKTLGILHVSAAKIPVSAPDGYFRRVGETEQALNSQDLVVRMSAIPDHSAAITSLSQTIATQTTEIGKLRESFDTANSWKRKAFYAFLGAAASAIVKLILNAAGF